MKIFKLYKSIYGVIVILFMISLVSCEDEETITEFPFPDSTKRLLTEKLGEVDLFYKAAEKAGLVDLFTGETEYTFFVPNNKAVQVALEANGFISINDAEVSFLQTFVNNHIVEGKVASSDLSKTTVTNLAGNPILVSVAGGVSLNADATVSNPNNETQNGMVHIVDFPLLDFPSANITGIVDASAAASDAEFTILQYALEYSGLDAALAGDGPFTVFAPTDAAFAAAGIDQAAIDGLSVEAVTELLQFHVLDDRYFTLELPSGRNYTLAGDSSEARGFDFDVEDTGIAIDVAIGNAETTTINILATNGTIHVVNTVLQPEPFLFEAINGTFGLSGFDGTLLGAYYDGLLASSFNFDSLLSSEVEYTLFVPRFFVNPGTEPELTEELKAHIFPGIVEVGSIAGSKITSINDQEYFATLDANERLTINGRSGIQRFTSGNPIIQNYDAYNGLVTNFLSPFTPLPDVDAATIVDGVDSLSLFKAALEFLELDSLSNVTYLYVANDDFAAAYDEAGITADPANLEDADIDVLEEIVNSHIITTLFFSNALADGVEFTDRNGEPVSIGTLNAAGESAFGIIINDEGDIKTIGFSSNIDVLANNGIIHVINDIILQ